MVIVEQRPCTVTLFFLLKMEFSCKNCTFFSAQYWLNNRRVFTLGHAHRTGTCNPVLIFNFLSLITGAGEGLLREQGRAEAGLPGILREIPHQEIPARAASLLIRKITLSEFFNWTQLGVGPNFRSLLQPRVLRTCMPICRNNNAPDPAVDGVAKKAAERIHLVRQTQDGLEGSAVASEGHGQRHLSGKQGNYEGLALASEEVDRDIYRPSRYILLVQPRGI